MQGSGFQEDARIRLSVRFTDKSPSMKQESGCTYKGARRVQRHRFSRGCRVQGVRRVVGKGSQDDAWIRFSGECTDKGAERCTGQGAWRCTGQGVRRVNG
jgi:hypothetical protein